MRAPMVAAQLAVALGFAAACRVVLVGVGLSLLWLRPRSVAKRLLGASFVVLGASGIIDVGFLVDFPGGMPAWFLIQNVLIDVSILLLLGFLCLYPSPPRLRSWRGGLGLAVVGYAVVATAVEIVTLNASDASRLTGPYSTAFAVLRVVASLLCLEAIRREGGARSRAATHVVLACSPLLLIFGGYEMIAAPLRFLGVPFQHRYGDPGPPVIDAAYIVDTATSLGFVLFASWRYRTRLPLLVAAIGAVAVGLDQFSRYDIVDFGIANLVPALVALHAVAREGLFEVRRMPARAGLLLGGFTAASIFIAVAAVFTLMASNSPFFIMLGSLTGLVAGAIVAYQVRPRGVGLAIYRNAESDLPARVMTSTPAGPGARVAGRYLVDRVLGEGGQARAFLARDEVLGRDVVLKTLPAGEPAALREARVLAMLDHPNVIRIHDVLETAHETLVVLEYAPKGSLRDVARRRPPMGAQEAARLVDQVLAGLEAAHQVGVVHGDVKLENVLVGEGDVLKLADFGVSSAPRRDVTLAPGGGTLRSMSPEQIRGEPADARSDVYAASLLLAELAGCAPWPSSARLDDFELRALLLTRDPDLRALDPALREVVARGLSRDPSRRYASAGEMRAALRVLSASRS